MGKINDASIDSFDKEAEEKFLLEREEAKITPSVRKYMSSLALKSVKVQAKKYGKKKFSDMGKKAGLSHTRRAEERKRLALDKAGDLVDATLK